MTTVTESTTETVGTARETGFCSRQMKTKPSEYQYRSHDAAYGPRQKKPRHG